MTRSFGGLRWTWAGQPRKVVLDPSSVEMRPGMCGSASKLLARLLRILRKSAIARVELGHSRLTGGTKPTLAIARNAHVYHSSRHYIQKITYNEISADGGG